MQDFFADTGLIMHIEKPRAKLGETGFIQSPEIKRNISGKN